jgi:peptidoglycan/xylan/chitin deacetylase (PgdA/CDA1 family)
LVELSVIILTYGRVELLRTCLEALCHQTQAATEFEVVIAVCGATNGTREVLDDFVTPFRLRVIWQIGSSPGAARNRAVEATVGRYCLFLDDDISAEPRLVAEHLSVQRERAGVVGIGQILLKLPSRADAFARYLAQERRDHYARLGQGRPPSFLDCYRGNMSVPRAVLLEVGGFAVDLRHSETNELGYRLGCQGLSFVYVPEAMGQQNYRKRFREIVTDVEMEGVTGIELYRRHPPMLPHLRVGAFNDGRLPALLLRRLLLALGGPIQPLAIIGPLLRKQSWRGPWYRFLYSYCYWRGVRRAVPDRETWLRLTRGTSILMYHACGYAGELPSLYVIPARCFARQMAWLKRRRYHVLSLEEFLSYHRGYRLPPAHSVVITFDDGYADNRTVAYPTLRQHGFPATIFLVSRAVEATNQWDSEGELAGRPLLSWSDIKEMLHGGISFGAHTRNHVSLTTVPVGQAEDEVAGSRADLERKLGLPILAFAYPNGKHDPTGQAMVEGAGFLGAVSSHPGVNDPATPLYILRRTEIRGTCSFVRFALALWLGRTRLTAPRSSARRLEEDRTGY